MVSAQELGRKYTKAFLATPAISIPLTRSLVKIPILNSVARRYGRLPVAGSFSRSLPSGEGSLHFWSDGHDSVMTRVFWSGIASWEPGTMRVLPALLQDASTFLDIGASSGVYGLLVAATDPTCSVYCFEPAADTFERLRRNRDANQLQNLSIENKALTRNGGPITLYITRHQLDASTLSSYRKRTVATQVDSLTLDQFIHTQDIERLDLLKIDTEGTEPEVFAGGVRTITRDHPTIICEVLKGMTEKELEDFFGPLGYSYYLLTSDGPEARSVIEGESTASPRNYLFVHESKSADIFNRIARFTGDRVVS